MKRTYCSSCFALIKELKKLVRIAKITMEIANNTGSKWYDIDGTLDVARSLIEGFDGEETDGFAIKSCDRCGMDFNPRLRKSRGVEYIGMLCDDCQEWLEKTCSEDDN